MKGFLTLPTSQRVSELLSGTLPTKVMAKPLPPSRTIPTGVTATYIDADGVLKGICVCDMDLAAALAAALVLIPAVEATSAARRTKLSDLMLDSLQEVLNITAQLLRPTASSTRISLGQVYQRQDDLPENVMATLKRPMGRRDFEVAITGYPGGQFSVMGVFPSVARPASS